MSTNQVETATVIGSCTGNGNATVTVTAARMTNSPKAVSAALTTADNTAALVATKCRYALALDADVSAFFATSGTGADIILTTRTPAPNDTTLNIAIANDTCTGLTAAPTSANTTAGSGISNGYATLAEYKTWIAARGLSGSVGTDASDDTIIETLIESASRYFDNETGRKFLADSSDATRYYTTDDSFCVKVNDLSAAPTSVSVDLVNDRTYTELASSGVYELSPANALLDGKPYRYIEIIATSGYYFPTTPRGVKVVGKFGFPSVPTDVKDAVLSITQSLYGSRSGQSPSGGRVSVTAAGIVIRPEDVPVFAQKIIQHYRPKT